MCCQVGCAMNCQFCFTGRRGLLGNLSTAQILEQVLVAQKLLERGLEPVADVNADTHADTTARDAGPAPGPHSAAPSPASASPRAAPRPAPPPPITNLVFMGMGEPLHNPRAVFTAIDVLTHRRALGMAASRITLSTVGLLPQLQHFLHRYAPVEAGAAVGDEASSHGSNINIIISCGILTTLAFSVVLRICCIAISNFPLAVSIHAGTDELRAAIVPSNNRLVLPLTPSPSPASSTTPAAAGELESQGGAHNGGEGGGSGGGAGADVLRGLAALTSVLARHYPRTDRRPLRAGRYVLFEYTMLGGVNDRPEDAAALLEATRHVECSFNLIMFNPFPGTVYAPSTPERVWEFARVLRAGGRIVHVRLSKGDSGMAACGQLGDVGPRAEERRGARMLPEARALAAAAAAAAGAAGAAEPAGAAAL
ncbi:hypothetical protein GPECTOR_15g476 [Gonium pectorale]|uniref:Radical SAM core domain-containing protein n=1 Tax=Gonium pectorale TaxID=33097 RepID=A0A150GN67_GONPE|nr:hypothetical protein GPECTOR_15g476 [Gonium pectorale]|eukprot:KXZ50790.1 hypothetical protein GPECTOR_15g476 [Gonium pectorale]